MYDAFAVAVSSRARAAAIQSTADVLNEPDTCTEASLTRDGGTHLLLAGCGTGLSIPSLANMPDVAWIEAVDASPTMLRRARTRYRTLDAPSATAGFRQADCRSLTYPDDTFDLVFSLYMLDVLPRPDRVYALRSIARVLRPRGTLITATLAPPRCPVERFWTGAARVVPVLLGGGHPVDLRPALQLAGFDIGASSRHVQAGLASQVITSRRAL